MEDKKNDIERQFIEMYEVHVDAIFRFCAAKVSDRDIAKDLMQETFIRVWDFLRRGKEIQSPKLFIYRVANNIVIDHYRKKKPVSLDNLAEDGFEPSDGERDIDINLIDGEKAMALVEKLSPVYRDVILLHYAEGLSIAEIAEILSESANNVSVRLHRGIKKLKEHYHHE